MINISKTLVRWFAANIAFVTLLISCGTTTPQLSSPTDSGALPPIPVNTGKALSIHVIPQETIFFKPGEQQRLKVQVFDSRGIETKTNLSFESSRSDDVMVSAEGTLISKKSIGSTTITVTAIINNQTIKTTVYAQSLKLKETVVNAVRLQEEDVIATVGSTDGKTAQISLKKTSTLSQLKSGDVIFSGKSVKSTFVGKIKLVQVLSDAVVATLERVPLLEVADYAFNYQIPASDEQITALKTKIKPTCNIEFLPPSFKNAYFDTSGSSAFPARLRVIFKAEIEMREVWQLKDCSLEVDLGKRGIPAASIDFVVGAIGLDVFFVGKLEFEANQPIALGLTTTFEVSVGIDTNVPGVVVGEGKVLNNKITFPEVDSNFRVRGKLGLEIQLWFGLYAQTVFSEIRLGGQLASAFIYFTPWVENRDVMLALKLEGKAGDFSILKENLSHIGLNLKLEGWGFGPWELNRWKLWTMPPTPTPTPTPIILPAPIHIEPSGTVTSLTPTLSWQPVVGASYYGVYVRDTDTNVLVLNLDGVGTSYTIPSGILHDGGNYRWNTLAFGSNNVQGSFSSAWQINVRLPVLTPPPAPTPSYQTISLLKSGTNLALNIDANIPSRGADIEGFTWGDGDEMWYLKPANSGQLFAHNGDKCLDAAGAMYQGGHVGFSSCDSGLETQQMHIEPGGAGQTQVRIGNSSFCLNVDGNGYWANFSPVTLYPCDWSNDQQWSITYR